MAIIRSGATSDLLTVDPTSLAARVTLYDPTGKSIIRKTTGIYKYGTAVLSVQVAVQNGTSTGHFWIINPIGSSKLVAVRRMEVQFAIGANTTTTTTPRTVLRRFIFTGTSSGAVILAAKRDSTDPTPTVIVATAVTGITPSLDNIEWEFLPPSMVGTAGWTFYHPSMLEYEPEDAGMTILRAGEGLVLFQPDAGGVTTDVRRFIVNLGIEEFAA